MDDVGREHARIDEHTAAATERPALPSMQDVASLAPDADYSTFLAKGVDKAVRRAAMKKLFADPHFNVMDGLDIYIDDYTKPSPLPPGMLAALQHARSTLEPRPLYKSQGEDDEENHVTDEADESERSDAPVDTCGDGIEPSVGVPHTKQDEEGAEDALHFQVDIPVPTRREVAQQPDDDLSQDIPEHSIRLPPP